MPAPGNDPASPARPAGLGIWEPGEPGGADRRGAGPGVPASPPEWAGARRAGLSHDFVDPRPPKSRSLEEEINRIAETWDEDSARRFKLHVLNPDALSDCDVVIGQPAFRITSSR
jgi:hypothetical protein